MSTAGSAGGGGAARTASKAADLTKLIALVVVAVLVVAAGIWFFRGRAPGGVDGRVHHVGDEPYGMTIGPNGWFAYSDDDGEWIEDATTGVRRAAVSSFLRSPVITSDGTAIYTSGPDVIIDRGGREIDVEGTDLLVAHGDRSLQPGDALEVIGLSAEHAAVVSCMSPGGGARLDEEVRGGDLIVSGVAWSDGTVAWSHDTGVGCSADLATLYPHGLPEQRYVLMTPREGTTEALDLDTGRVAKTWRDAPRGRVIVREDEAISRAGDEVTVTSLRTGEVVATTSCPGARLDNPGESGGRLAAEATPVVRCGEHVRLFDGTRFVTVDAPPVEESQLVPDGRSVVHDRFEISRAGDTLTLRDALADTVVGEVEVPSAFRISTNDPRGRLIVFFEAGDNWRTGTPEAEFRIVDTRTAELVATTDDDMSPGADVSTDGFAIISEWIEPRRGRAARTRSRHHAWLVGVDEVERRR